MCYAMCGGLTASLLLQAVVLGITFSTIQADELFQQDLTPDMRIGIAETGYKNVALKCGAEHMHVTVHTEDDFTGVIYTRGSFYDRKKPCFKDAKGGKKFTLKFPLDECQTKHEDDVYSNVVVVQYDDQLIMPGDAAFTVECDFSKPRDVTVGAELKDVKPAATSRISLADADPAGGELPSHRRSTVTSDSGRVEFTPDDIRPRKKKRKDKEEL